MPLRVLNWSSAVLGTRISRKGHVAFASGAVGRTNFEQPDPVLEFLAEVPRRPTVKWNISLSKRCAMEA